MFDHTYLRPDPFAQDAWLDQRSADPNICFGIDQLSKDPNSPWINTDHPNQIYKSLADAQNNVNATPVDPSQYLNGNSNPTTSGPTVKNDPTALGYDFGTTPQAIAAGLQQSVDQSNQIIGNATSQGQANLTAAAGATMGAGQDILKNGYDQQNFQQTQGMQGLAQGQQLADYNTQLGQQALGGLSQLGQQANNASAFYGGQGVEQLANAGQDRQAQLAQIAALNQYTQQGPGPSAAEAQLQMANAQTQANALSLANSGRGAGDSAQAQRQAMFSNAATQATTNQQMAQLRAQEAATWRGQQLQGMTQNQSAVAGLQGADIGASNAAGSLGANYAGVAQNYYGQGVTAQGAAAGQANQALGTGQSYNQGMTGNANTAAGQGTSAYDSLSGQANNLTGASTAAGLQGAGLQAAGVQAANQGKNNLMTGAMQNDTQKYGIDKGVAIQTAQMDTQKQAAYVSGAAALGAGVITALSDRDAKKNIRPIVEMFRQKKADPMQYMMQIASLQKAS